MINVMMNVGLDVVMNMMNVVVMVTIAADTILLSFCSKYI